MDASALDRRITFQERTATQNSATGAYTYAWADIGTSPTVWAKVVEETRAEKIEAEVALASQPCVIFIRYRSDITAAMRVVYGSRTMRIAAGPAEVGRREWLKLVCENLSTEGVEP